MTYTPDKWVVLEMNNGSTITIKVFAGWNGGYLSFDSWKLNSGSVSAVEYSNRWEFTAETDNVYVCYKNAYGMSSHMKKEFNSWLSELINLHTIEIIESFKP